MKIDNKSINVARCVASETISNANSGHTGVALSAATILYSLFKDHYVFSTNDNLFLNRDRFILSAGHASALYYTLEHMFGYDITIEDLMDYRKYDSKTPGHPEFGSTPGVEATTGPLGQGIANGVGMAIAETMLAERFNVLDDPIFSNYTYVFAGDGCFMEGVALEAISLAGTLKLNKLIVLYDCNSMTMDGKLGDVNAEDVARKFIAQNWNVIYVKNGNNYKAVTKAIGKAKQSKDKPTIVIFKTILGYGSDYANNPIIHGMALKSDEVTFLRQRLFLEGNAFEIPEDVKKHCIQSKIRNEKIEMDWRKKVNLYSKTNPELYKKLAVFIDSKFYDVEKLVGTKIKDKKISGRNANSIILNLLADKYPNIVGGTADVACSTRAYIGDDDDYSPTNRRGRNIKFGIREHAMAAIANGISLYAGLKVFVSTFLSFSNYMIPAIRLSAMMKQPVLYIFTHDSIMVGEDGPTHQPVEQIAQLRAIPDVNVCRPCDSHELTACYNIALNSTLPTCLVLSRQDLTEQKIEPTKAMKGGYVLEKDSGKPQFVLYATGSEVELAMGVKREFNKLGVKCAVVSFPCIEEFERQTESYKNSTLMKECKYRFAIEASSDNVWYKYVGNDGKVINITKFGKSGKGSDVYKRYGFSVANIKKEIMKTAKINI